VVDAAPRLELLRRLPPQHPNNRSRRARATEAAAWRLFDSRAVARLSRREHVLGIGDSHIAALAQARVPGAWLRPFGLGGATASGIRNPASQTRARELFEARLALAPRWQHLLVGLGEVDCGFVIWHRAQRHGIGVSRQLGETLDSYAAFLAELRGSGFRSVSVLSATLPTVANYADAHGNPGLRMRSAIEVPLAERTELTLAYNAALAERCAAIGAAFVDTTPEQLDPAMGLVRSSLALADDPHLDPAGYARILSRALRDERLPWRHPATDAQS
jgi:hypothetical protein